MKSTAYIENRKQMPSPNATHERYARACVELVGNFSQTHFHEKITLGFVWVSILWCAHVFTRVKYLWKMSIV